MNSMAYLAGVAAESNINQAIRAQEQRAHGYQLSALQSLHRETLARYNEHIENYKAAVSLTIERQREKYTEMLHTAEGLANALAAYQEAQSADEKLIKRLATDLKDQYDNNCVGQAMAFVRLAEAENLISTVIPGVVDTLFRHMGKEPDPNVREHVVALIKHVMPGTTDPTFREEFRARIHAEIAKADSRKERFEMNQAQFDKISEIVEALTATRNPQV